MNRQTLKFLSLLLVSASLAHADVQMTLTGVNGSSLGIAYIDPYIATIDGVGGQMVICDDFTAETWIGETWRANQSDVSKVSTTGPQKFTSPTLLETRHNYDAAAWLAEQLMALTPNPSGTYPVQAGIISYAIWSIFAPGATNGLDSGTVAAINGKRTDAFGATANSQPADFSNVAIYTATLCDGKPCSTATPQEFLLVRTNNSIQSVPEASASAILAVHLLGVLGLVFLIRRRTIRNPGCPTIELRIVQ